MRERRRSVEKRENDTLSVTRRARILFVSLQMKATSSSLKIFIMTVEIIVVLSSLDKPRGNEDGDTSEARAKRVYLASI